MFAMEDSHFWFLGKRLCIDAVLQREVISSKKRILDIGCGTGGATVYLKKYGEIVGLENDVYAYSCAKSRNLQVKMGSANELPFKDGSFDMVTLLDVLYHKNIPHVEKVIKEVRRVLSTHGTILITDSALPALWSKHDVIMEGKRRFVVSELEGLLRSNGFTIKRSSYYFFLIFPLLVMKRKIVDSFGKRYSADVSELPAWINTCGLFIMRIESFLLRYISFPYGSSLIIYAKKDLEAFPL